MRYQVKGHIVFVDSNNYCKLDDGKKFVNLQAVLNYLKAKIEDLQPIN